MKHSMLLICTLLVNPFISTLSFAQRGEKYAQNIDSTTPPKSPSNGFPGMFDSNVAEKNSFVLDIPLLAADYGVTENVTIGTNGYLVAAAALSAPVVYLKVRHRFVANSNWVSSNTGYLGYFTNRAGAPTEIIDSYFASASNNTTYYFKPNSYFNLTTLYMHFSLDQRRRNSMEFSSISMTSLILGPSYQHWFNDWFGLQGLVALSGYQSLEVDSSTLSASLNFGNGGRASGFSMARMLSEFRAGDWLISAGLVSLFTIQASSGSSANSSPVTFPWISAAVKW
jgi:hypothetical protein